MNQHKPANISEFDATHANTGTYVKAYSYCIVLTVAAYTIAVSDGIANSVAIGTIGGLAIIQLMVQLRYFLHLGTEFNPRWKLLAFVIMITIVFIFVAGSLWIMTNLNYRMIHSPDAMTEYVESQNGL